MFKPMYMTRTQWVVFKMECLLKTTNVNKICPSLYGWFFDKYVLPAYLKGPSL